MLLLTPPLLTAALIVIGLRGLTVLTLALCALTPGRIGQRALRALEVVADHRQHRRT